MEISGTIREIFNKFKEECNKGTFKENLNYELYIVQETPKTKEEKRRKEANDKYWSLLNQYVKWHKECGYTEQHNKNLAEYSPILMEKGQDGRMHKVITFKPKGYEWDKQMERHLKPIGKYFKGDDGKEYEYFYEVKKSSEMSVKEFSDFLDMFINEIEGSDAPIDCHKEVKQWGK